MTDPPQDDFEALLDHLKVERGLDFTGYKRASLQRRITKRMQELGLDGDFASLQDHLEVHPEAYQQLLDTVLINVTAFFRDPDAWTHLSEHVIPTIEADARGRPIRVWSAGCASGEEPYTIAMLLAERLGERAMRERVKIYATDVDEDALTTARAAVYTPQAIETVPEPLRSRYFEEVGGAYLFSPDLRRSVIFGRHDLVRDAPISRLDLLVCRNVLIYFNRETQTQVLERLHFAIRPSGFLFLGRAEMLLSRSQLFTPTSLQHRVFRATSKERPVPAAPSLDAASDIATDIARRAVLRDWALDTGPTAQLVIDAQRTVTVVNARARTLFGLQHHDVGRPLRDLEVSYRPVELRSHLDQVFEERRAIQLRAIELPVEGGSPQYLDVLLTPLLDDGALLGAAISFTDVTQPEELRARLQDANRDLEDANEELQSTNEELETTNEELQSANEELETTNEELQSANEELETMNEELQSANAQQVEVSHELQSRSAALDRTNAFLEAILASLDSAVVVVDDDLTVHVWSARAFEDWGLRGDEVIGQSLMDLDIGLPAEELVRALREALAGSPTTLDVEAVNRRGRRVSCHVTTTPLMAEPVKLRGAVLLIEVADPAVPS